MADNRNPGGAGSGPAEQLQQTMQAVTSAIHTAGERVRSGSQAVGHCAIRQAEEGAALLFRTLREMADSQNAEGISTLYSQYLQQSVQLNVQQLREMADVLAAQSKDSWEPVANAIKSAMPQSPFSGK